jgi:hypothetical protein
MYKIKPIEIVLLVCIIILLVYIVHRFIYKKHHGFLYREGATDLSGDGLPSKDNQESKETTETSTVKIDYPPRTAFNDPSNLPLKEYAIYASFNSSYDGKSNTLEQLGTVMYEGCRFIDLNVFQVNDDYYVGFAKDNAPTVIETSLPLTKVIEYINTYAFTLDSKIGDKVKASYRTMIANSIQTNAADKETIQKNYTNYPLFVNVRVYRPPNSKTDIATGVLKMITGKNGLRNLYLDGEVAKPVHQFTPLKDISKKVILSMDYQNILQLYASVGNNIYDAKNIPVETLKQINQSVNIQIGSDNWQAFYKYADVENNRFDMLTHKDTSLEIKHSYETNTRVMKLAYPYFNESSNPDSYAYIQKYKIQTIPVRFYIDDANLTKYNKLFYEQKTPFVPLYNAYTYILANS